MPGTGEKKGKMENAAIIAVIPPNKFEMVDDEK
jgi:hypothetical protein